MIELLRLFLGWNEFKIEGSSNVFLTRFSENLWMVRKSGSFTTARCLTKDYKFLKKKSIECGCFLYSTKKAGFLNFLNRYKFRFGLLVGFISFILAILISNFFVWNIEIVGNSMVGDEEIFKICDKNGLHFGSAIFKVNEQDIEHKLKEEHPEISWVSLNRIAGKYIIEISELKQKPKIVDWNGPCDVLANFDGEILYIEAYSGTPLVDVGDCVKKGQILITGVQEMKGMENVVYSSSDGRILAKVKRHNETSIKKNSVVPQKTGIQKTEKRLGLFSLKLPLILHKKNKNIVKVNENFKPLEFLGLRFPFLIYTTVYDVYEDINLCDNVRKIKRILVNKQKQWEEKELIGNKILSRKYNFEEDDEDIKLKADVFVQQRIDEKAPINLEMQEHSETSNEN